MGYTETSNSPLIQSTGLKKNDSLTHLKERIESTFEKITSPEVKETINLFLKENGYNKESDKVEELEKVNDLLRSTIYYPTFLLGDHYDDDLIMEGITLKKTRIATMRAAIAIEDYKCRKRNSDNNLKNARLSYNLVRKIHSTLLKLNTDKSAQ